jgi:hypothetical protein
MKDVLAETKTNLAAVITSALTTCLQPSDASVHKPYKDNV